ncbi:hypothetical protein COY93_00165 [Candidatus Uhrbacteria bacterium CG_4_10_14_0_8_um_filter_58_22]|uniref:Uncharacterized protein n=1 Tax=Candidatus Uhrbacteria bacterium CG_4_10_14_0_8_um_filter_58_22 TaxID=1975029 RepID=A0A2M7QC85_9BACT|nr:MAG: hypothetical protein AUJ19_02730 [Parcubacteria group bacterium CG1_02_58_44]PIY63403.1 MAG: hypothetical protein COY93_00165 [Candidatus Uhrbacteria bacterium CG_4_10_14_0_8_um_filter_58_22]
MAPEVDMFWLFRVRLATRFRFSFDMPIDLIFRLVGTMFMVIISQLSTSLEAQVPRLARRN